ncbi:UvrD-helicase domain-containing protein [Deinococcus sp. RM]|uniref:UvrD-helicase domain-containing protein n=1 Tax=Deinococcus sp. RM TaxID=2316359 RepID=UPI001F26C454|nr:UvrD-helicase domain-containing protein [Deinococcus sp. RM]
MTTRAIPAHFTAEQQRFMAAVRDTRRHLFLRATAGAGKTTTLTEAAWHLDVRGVYFAYNKHAVADLQPRLPERVRALTLHAHGFRLLQDLVAGPLQVQDDKARRLAGLILQAHPKLQAAAARAWTLAREEHLHALTEDLAQRVADRVQWPGAPRDLMELIPLFHEIGAGAWDVEGQADFTDLLWLPVTQGHGAASLPLALVDEAQDLTPLRQAYVRNLLGLMPGQDPAGRLIFVGDSDQSIYMWAGADPLALSRLKTAVDALEFPLSVSFRCPREVVRYARAYSDFITPAPQAKAGVIEHIPAQGATYTRGDVVLCRTNAPLIRLALDLMAQHLSVAVTGRDLARRLREGLDGSLPETFVNDDVTELVRAYLAPLAEPLATRIADGDLGAKRAMTELQDVGRCLRYLGWVVSRKTGEGTQGSALQVLGQLCREDADADVLLASVHRAKGKEWPRVTVLYPELMPMSQGNPTEERAVQFVAVTRAQQVLRFAYGPERWAAQEFVSPGILPPAPEAVMPVPQPVVPATLPDPVSLVPPCSAPGVPTLPKRPVGGPPVAHLKDPRRSLPLLGGTTPIPVELLLDRLRALAEEDRQLLRTWAADSLALLRGVEAGFVGIHAGHLDLFEQAARQARLPVPALFGTGVGVCVYEGPLVRVRLARTVRITKRAIRVALGEQELRFDRASGELLDGAAPLTPFIRAADLSRLQAS